MKLRSEVLIKIPKGVIETPIANDEADLWAEEYTQTDIIEYPGAKWRKHKLCRPSCIPISILCVMIFLVVLLPVLDQATEKALQEINKKISSQCTNPCELKLIESIPEGLVYNGSSTDNPSTFDTWLKLINLAHGKIEIASFYWTLRHSEVYPDPSSNKGETIFQALLKAGTDKGISIRIAQNAPTQKNPNIDTEYLVKRKAADVVSLNFAKLLGSGVLHTKFWIVDRMHIYIGSANMDWRALTQVKELGIAVYNCSCLANDLGKIFDAYWYLGKTQKIPEEWSPALSTPFNIQNPMNITFNNDSFNTFLTSSPQPFNPQGRTNDIDALLYVINNAEKFVYIAVMDYFPLTIYTPKLKFWPVIDDAIKTAAIDHKIKIKMLISWWNHSRTSEDSFLRSLTSLENSYPQVSIEVRRFIVPANKTQQKIPYARVNHNKYMVTDNMAFIGTSNWSGDYFIDTAGVSFVLHDPLFERNSSHSTIRSQLQDVFERDWNSSYAHSFYT
ncbi:5'-3' exonuclease PLD3-like [Coccinella septempunctata]|uniref:5'-3' exonuclease PLD3-like n=1 Tax=Coccinella septempunctata TaxID=41139 RepID=UPI001D0797E4|nr:5'-3' exonuclease PLD3-like [Coccinella septempunctata]